MSNGSGLKNWMDASQMSPSTQSTPAWSTNGQSVTYSLATQNSAQLLFYNRRYLVSFQRYLWQQLNIVQNCAKFWKFLLLKLEVEWSEILGLSF